MTDTGSRPVSQIQRSPSLALVTLLALLSLVFALFAGASITFAQDDVTVTQNEQLEGCNGVRETPGSENTRKEVIGEVFPDGVATFRMTFPVDEEARDADSFIIDDCLFFEDEAIARWTIDAPNNSQENDGFLIFEVTIDLPDAEAGTEYCNHAKHTGTAPEAPASNRKASVCFVIAEQQLPAQRSTPPAESEPAAPSQPADTAASPLGAGGLAVPLAAVFLLVTVAGIGTLAYTQVRARR